MRNAIRNAVIVMPLGLALVGCGGPHPNKMSDRAPERKSGTTKAPAEIDGGESYKMDEAAPAPLNETMSGVDSQHDITLEQIQDHMEDNSAVVIDARSPESFARAHLRGAINVPSGQIEAFVKQIKENVSEDEFIIIYCASSTCGAGDVVYKYLAVHGYTNMRVYKPGWQQLALAKNLQ